jgi:Gpi18-like mannosyltransferase
VSTSGFFGIEPNLHRRGLQRTNQHSTNIRLQLHTDFLPSAHLLLLTLRKHQTGYGDIGRFTSLFPVFNTRLITLFCHRKGSPSAVFLSLLTVCLTKRQQFCFLPQSVVCTPHFLSNSALYGQMDKIFAEPGLQDLASLVSCFDTEGSGLRLAALTVLPVEGCQCS